MCQMHHCFNQLYSSLPGVYVCVVVPAEQRLQVVQAAVILLPDENREVLQTLLYFLSDIASAQENQMTAESLAVCLAPSILHLNASKKDGASPRCVWVKFRLYNGTSQGPLQEKSLRIIRSQRK